jgi:hypothetical protein
MGQLKENIIEGYRTTFGGVLMILLCAAYYFHYEVHLYYCVSGMLIGIGLVVAPDQIVPIFVNTLKTLLDAVVSRVAALIGKK